MNSIKHAAAEIVALINSRPTTPSAAEIAALLNRIGAGAPPMSPAHAALYQVWRKAIEEHVRAFPDGSCPGTGVTPEVEAWEARADASTDAVDRLAWRILETPACTWGDVVLFAEIAYWAQWRGTDPEGPEAKEWMATGLSGVGGLCDDSLVKLIEAILSVAGIGKTRP